MQLRISPYPLRMESTVRGWYEAQAKKNGRSLQKELNKVLIERMNRVIGAENACRK
ncbi:hypothetical protein OTK51_04610 [Vibrio scophthalmi]|uniref:hypothetical protein n=1 Tax=Vibrio scophthalmi TaxID=45658 RepID=UPI002283EFFC|nr:hypothetical protein [Vibrio scophthalmi]MCY9802710.1 hypothetical protein [Vibrio scophthalmi]